MEKTIRLTVAQAIVKFLDQQYVCFDGKESKFVEGFFTIFGHGIALGIGQALDENPGSLHVMQGRNEQGMCHAAIAFAKQHNRRKIIPCTSSVGPGSANMLILLLNLNSAPTAVFTENCISFSFTLILFVSTLSSNFTNCFVVPLTNFSASPPAVTYTFRRLALIKL